MYLLFLFCCNYWKVFSAGLEFQVGTSFLLCREHAAHCVLASAAGVDTPSLCSMFSVPCVFLLWFSNFLFKFALWHFNFDMQFRMRKLRRESRRKPPCRWVWQRPSWSMKDITDKLGLIKTQTDEALRSANDHVKTRRRTARTGRKYLLKTHLIKDCYATYTKNSKISTTGKQMRLKMGKIP